MSVFTFSKVENTISYYYICKKRQMRNFQTSKYKRKRCLIISKYCTKSTYMKIKRERETDKILLKSESTSYSLIKR